MTNENRPGRARALTTLALLLCAPLAGCGSDEPTGRPKPAPPAPVENKAPEPDAGDRGAPKRPPLAVAPTEWPGVEGRLSALRPNGNFLLVEVELVNTGTAPVTIEHYSVVDATMIDDASKRLHRVLTPPGRQPLATTDLTQTLQPGESTAVNATFSLPSTARLVTLTFPRIGPFDDVKLYHATAAPQPRDKGEKGDKAAPKTRK